jgi:hypothetical protein
MSGPRVLGLSRPAVALCLALASVILPLPAGAVPPPPNQTVGPRPAADSMTADDGARPAVMPSRCVAHVLSLQLLTGDGSPGVPVTIDGTDGMAFLGLTQETTGVFDRPEMDYPHGRALAVQTVTGTGRTYMTRIDRLALGRGMAQDIESVMLGPIGDRKVAGRPVLGILGYDILGNYDVLLDFPDQTVTLFKETEAPGCLPVSRLVGGAPYAAPLMPDTRGMDVLVQVAIDGVPIGMELEPGSNASIIQVHDAADLGADAAALADDPRSRTDAGIAIVGHRHRFTHVVLGTYHGADLTADVTPSAFNVLGMNFFRGRRVLFAFPSRMLYFSDAPTPAGPQPAHIGFSPAQSRLADTAVQDQPPDPPVASPASPAAQSPPGGQP